MENQVHQELWELEETKELKDLMVVLDLQVDKALAEVVGQSEKQDNQETQVHLDQWEKVALEDETVKPESQVAVAMMVNQERVALEDPMDQEEAME